MQYNIMSDNPKYPRERTQEGPIVMMIVNEVF